MYLLGDRVRMNEKIIVPKFGGKWCPALVGKIVKVHDEPCHYSVAYPKEKTQRLFPEEIKWAFPPFKVGDSVLIQSTKSDIWYSRGRGLDVVELPQTYLGEYAIIEGIQPVLKIERDGFEKHVGHIYLVKNRWVYPDQIRLNYPVGTRVIVKKKKLVSKARYPYSKILSGVVWENYTHLCSVLFDCGGDGGECQKDDKGVCLFSKPIVMLACDLEWAPSSSCLKCGDIVQYRIHIPPPSCLDEFSKKGLVTAFKKKAFKENLCQVEFQHLTNKKRYRSVWSYPEYFSIIVSS